jgi:hypothetical protein
LKCFDASTRSCCAGLYSAGEMPPIGAGHRKGNLLAFKPSWPAGRLVLPRLPPPVDGQVKQPIAVIYRLDAAPRRPVRLEDIGSLSANNVHHAHPASNQEGVGRVLGRVPRHLPAPEVVAPGALFVWTLAKRGAGNVARMKIGQFADLRSHCCGAGSPVCHMSRWLASGALKRVQ